MRDRAFLEDEIRREDLAACSALLGNASDNFGALVAATGMNPVSDFICGDLAGCDFSNTDIRGFNFSGANLTGAMLHNTQWDETTILIGADIGGTPFAFDREQQHFFADNPKWDRMARSLAAADWMEVELWIGKDHPEDQADAVSRVAFQIFRKTKSSYVKSVILLHARYQFSDQDDYRDFLLAELARPHDASFAVTCITLLGRLFADDAQVAKVCETVLSNDAERVRRAAIAALMNGIQGAHLPDAIRRHIAHEPSGEIRRYLLGRLVRRMSDLHKQIAGEGLSSGRYRDFKEPVSDRTVRWLAETFITPKDAADVALDEVESTLPAHLKPNSAAAAKYLDDCRRCKKVRLLFADFQRIGLQFVLPPQKTPEPSSQLRSPLSLPSA